MTECRAPNAKDGDGRPASLRSRIAPFIVMDVMRAASAREAAGADIIHMEVGQPSTPAPRLAREAAKRAIETQTLGYTQSLGMPELRERIARHYAESYAIGVDAQRVIVTSGSSAGFILAYLACLDAGETLALPNPGYPCYRQIASALGISPLLLPAGEKEGWALAADSLDRREFHGALIAGPANPTGAMASPEQISDAADSCSRRGAVLISDEIYHGLTYGRPAQTALAFNANALVINSFSKYYSMTGWRIGWMIAPPHLVRPIERLQQNLFISPPAISQAAALAAFDAADELEAHKAVYAASRDLLMNELPAAGFGKIAPPDGGFYLYADISDRTGDSVAFAARMLDETGVAATPGVDFDPENGARFIRFSYAGSTAQMREAARRLRAWRRL